MRRRKFIEKWEPDTTNCGGKARQSLDTRREDEGRARLVDDGHGYARDAVAQDGERGMARDGFSLDLGAFRVRHARALVRIVVHDELVLSLVTLAHRSAERSRVRGNLAPPAPRDIFGTCVLFSPFRPGAAMYALEIELSPLVRAVPGERVVALDFIPPSTLLASISTTALLSLKTTSFPPQHLDTLSNYPPPLTLALVLLHESILPHSPWSTYIRSLPSHAVPIATLWPPEALRWIQGTQLATLLDSLPDYNVIHSSLCSAILLIFHRSRRC